MTELFNMAFFQNAFFVSLVLSVLFGIFSFFVVMRKMTFIGAGIAHTAFGGVALGVFFGLSPFWTSLVFCSISAVIISALARNQRIGYDTGIGIFFSFSMALGAILIALKKSYAFDLSGYLFGNILGINRFDLNIILVSSLIFIPFILIFLQKILFITIDEQVAKVSGIPVEKLDTILMLLLAWIIVISIKIVGIILVSALIVLPASFGTLLHHDYRKVILTSILFTVVIMIGGLFLSYILNTPAGATMVMLGIVGYFSGFCLKSMGHNS